MPRSRGRETASGQAPCHATCIRESVVRAVRRGIGDTGRAQQLIQIVYGYGYRFIATVEVSSDFPHSAAGEAVLSCPGLVSAPPPEDGLNAALVPLTL